MPVETAFQIVVIDDDAAQRKSLAEILRDNGYKVATAFNGNDALALLANCKTLPDIIILDLNMPGLDGHGFRQQQRHYSRLAAIPVILVSGENNIHQHAAALQIENFLPKPVDVERLLGVLKPFFP